MDRTERYVEVERTLKQRTLRHCGLFLALATIVAFSCSGTQSRLAHAGSCTPTGYIQGALNLTAAQVVTGAGGVITGPINATGCNIGIYFAPGSSGTVSSADISGSNYYGVLNNGGSVTVTGSQIHDIGDTPFTGAQHGIGVQFINSATPSLGAKGSITNNHISVYQKNGIKILGTGTTALVTGNTVTGEGPTNRIAQNGIVIGAGALASVLSNNVSNNAYTGTDAVAAGILVYGGVECYGVPLTTNTSIVGNTVINNDLGVAVADLADTATCSDPATTPTRVNILANTIRNNAVTNNGSDLEGDPGGYQAGVSDQGDYDNIIANRICGIGYTPVVPPPHLFTIDTTKTNNPTVVQATPCISPVSPSSLASHNQARAAIVQHRAKVAVARGKVKFPIVLP